MDDLILWFNWLFRELLAETTINLLNVIQFLLIFILFLIATRFLRRLLRPFIARLEIDEHAQERILWLVFLIVLAFGLVFGLTVLGIDLTLLERVLNYSIPVGQTELSLTKLLWFLAVVIGAVPLSKYLRLVLRDRKFREHNITIPFPQRDVHHYYERGKGQIDLDTEST